MELKLLERFLAVVDEGSLAGAARRLALTQQALSASIAALERDAGARLLDRGPGGPTTLTTAGLTLLPHARSQLAADRRAREALRALSDGRAGSVTIGVGETFAGDIIAHAITRVHADRPELRINVVEGYSRHILARLYAGEFDFVAAGVGEQAVRAGFEAETIYTANDVVACRPDHPLAASRPRLADLVGHSWLVPYARPSDVRVIIDTFTDAGLPPPTRFIGSDAYRIGMKLMAGNDFLLMTPRALVTSRLARAIPGLHILPVERPTVRRSASLVRSHERPMTAGAAAVFDAVSAAARAFVADVAAT